MQMYDIYTLMWYVRIVHMFGFKALYASFSYILVLQNPHNCVLRVVLFYHSMAEAADGIPEVFASCISEHKPWALHDGYPVTMVQLTAR